MIYQSAFNYNLSSLQVSLYRELYRAWVYRTHKVVVGGGSQNMKSCEPGLLFSPHLNVLTHMR